MSFGPLVEEFTGIETLNEFYEQYGWQCRYRQIGAGPLSVSVAALETEHFGLGRETVNRRICGHAVSPDDTISILIALSKANVLINGQVLDQAALILIRPRSGMDVVIGGGADLLTVHIPVDAFEHCIGAESADYLADDADEITVLRTTGQEFDPIRGLAIDLLTNGQESRRSAETTSPFSEELCRVLTDGVATRMTGDPYRRLQKHSATIRIINFVHKHLAEQLEVNDLCTRFGFSLSTIEREFRRAIGVTPKQYIKAARLNRVRRDLLDARNADVPIAEIAMRYGLLHSGRFSADYRELFGRLPSEERDIAHNGKPHDSRAITRS